jgi:hypothetical protein
LIFTPYSLFDPQWPEEERPWVIGRKAFGKIAIANSDAGASAETDAAIDQAHRAVSEILHGESSQKHLDLQREFAEVIMVEVLIGEMIGSD